MKPGRNEPCSCGSGIKYKKCCQPTLEHIKTETRQSGTISADSPEGKTLITLFVAGQHAELERQTRLLLKSEPNSGFLWKVLGTTLQSQGKESLDALQRAAELLQDDAELHCNIGIVQKAEGQLDAAIASYARALKIDPENALAHSNLGNALRDKGKLRNAVECYHRALAIRSDFPGALINLSNVLRDLGQLDEAIIYCNKAIQIKPDFAEAYSSLANAQQDLGQLKSAVANYNHAIKIKPDFAEAHSNMGYALRDLGEYTAALRSCKLAVELEPNNAGALSNLGSTLRDIGYLNEALTSCRRAIEMRPGNFDAHTNLLFTHSYLPDQNSAIHLDDARRFDRIATERATPYLTWENDPVIDRILRIGLVSGDFRTHPVGFFIESILAALAHNTSTRLELIAYPAHLINDQVTERIKAHCHGWQPVIGLSDEELAQKIRSDGIDILIDISGHTARNRLAMFAWKPAPIQVSWLGYFATTGLAAIDYLIADHWTLLPSEEAHFTEKVWRLPETRLCFTPPTEPIAVASPPCTQNGFITFGCFNNMTKINGSVIALWSKILLNLPDSRLFLKAKQFTDHSIRNYIQRLFEDQGVSPERLVIEGNSPRIEYLKAYDRVDITLDTFPFPGGTTTVESLWMGVPVLTLAGQSFLSRQGVGILMNAGLPDWVAESADEYFTRALAHASSFSQLANMRSSLRQQVLASAIFDAPRFSLHFEAALREMWKRWCGVEVPKL